MNMTTQEIRAKKADFRKQYKKIRADVQDKQDKSSKIISNVLSSMAYKYSKKILLYSSVGSEPETLNIAIKALSDGKEVYFPISYDGGIMEFYKIDGLEDLSAGKFGIPEPSAKNELYTPGNSNELCLVPGLCFDINGYRIGYGKGYYDRFLSKFKGITVGIVFSDCISCVPVAFEKRHDKKVDMIISEKGLELIVCE